MTLKVRIVLCIFDLQFYDNLNAQKFRFFADGCRRDDGSFVEGGKTWALPNCQLGICAKSLTNGWEIATEV